MTVPSALTTGVRVRTTAFARAVPVTAITPVASVQVLEAVLAVAFARWVMRLWKGEPRRLIAPAWSLYALFWAIMAFWVLRNVPGFGFLGPGT